MVVGERGHYSIAASTNNHYSKPEKAVENDQTADKVQITAATADNIVQEVLKEVIDSILTSPESPEFASNLDDFTTPMDLTNDDLFASDFNRNLFGARMVEKGSSSSLLLEAYKIYTLFWCKELIYLNKELEKATSNDDSYMHIIMSFDENRVHFELILAIIVYSSTHPSLDDGLTKHIMEMTSLLSDGISSILDRRLLPKHHIIIMQAIISIIKTNIDSSDFKDNNDAHDLDLKLINCSIGHGRLLASFDSLKEGIKHIQRTLVIIHDFYLKYTDKYQDKEHLSSAFFIVFEMLDKKIKKSKSEDMTSYYISLKESYIIEYMEIFTPLLGDSSDVIHHCKYLLASTVYMPSNRLVESIAILNDLYITINDSNAMYWDVVSSLALCHYQNNEYDRAKVLYMEALDHKKSLDDNSEDNILAIAPLLLSIGHIYYDEALIDEAKGYYEEAYALVKKLLGSDHVFVVNIMISVANCFMTNCDYDSAHRIIYRIVGKRKSSKKGNEQIDNELINAIIKLHKIYINQYKSDSSRYKMLIEQVLDMLTILLNDDDNDILLQARKEYKAVSSESTLLKRLSLPLKGIGNNDEIIEKNGRRKSMFDNIPFRP